MHFHALILLVVIVEPVVVQMAAALLGQRTFVLPPFQDVEIVNHIDVSELLLLVLEQERSQANLCVLSGHGKLDFVGCVADVVGRVKG